MEKIHLFDMDGVLTDSMGPWINKMLRILDEHQIPYPEGVVRTITPLGDKGTAAYFIRLGVKATVEELVAEMDATALENYRYKIPLKPGVADYVKRLKAEGARLFVLTASAHRMSDPCLKRNGIYDCFERVWSTEDFGLTKDKVEIYYAAAKEIGCEPEDILFYDDNLNALKTGKKAGLHVIGVYDSFSEEDTPEIKAITEKYIRSFAEE